MDVEIRPIAPDELEAWARAMEASFSARLDEPHLELERMVAEPERYLAAFDGDRLVGCNGALTMQMTVPGGAQVPTAGISAVGVLQSHRRRGVSTAMMDRQFQEIRERGEALAALTASEAAIYGRFGFGIATRSCTVTADARRSAFVRGITTSGAIRPVNRAEAERTTAALADASSGRPGWVGPAGRFVPWWMRGGEFRDHKEHDQPLYVVHEDDAGRVDGVAFYRSKHEWPDDLPKVTIEVVGLLDVTPEAHAALWRFLLDLDLVETVEAWDCPPDDALLRLVAEPRALRFRIRDGLFLRLIDAPAALSARTYGRDGRLVLGVRDASLPENDDVWELSVEGGTAQVKRTTDEPDLVLSTTELAAAYLGDVSFSELAAALLVQGSPDSLGLADSMFASKPAPYCWLNF